jgi:ABC-type spermidine/putrescine transport system permease subunit II
MRIVTIALMLVAVIVPIIPLVLWSFTHSWPYEQILPNFGSQALLKTLFNNTSAKALANSLLLSATVVPISLILGFLAAKNLGTRRFKGRRAIQLLLLVPSFIPQISLVFGMQTVFSRIGLYNNFIGIVVALLVFYVPYTTLLLSAVFENYDMDYERQAATLGVGWLKTLLHVTIPAVRSGIIVTAIFSFIGTWSAYLVVSAIAPPTFKTMPLLLFPMINSGSNGYATTAVATGLYILPILLILVVFSSLLINDTDKTRTGGQI